ncbi:hypothetical protein [Novosphingobium sp. Fuku2-ISO-50]|uniref:hypothetical protein n=1 Tax=Novosphingobium sp. Fuku2-ISO-50 TaxID=1739114 RepID=UPI00076DBBAC|nr:hypothetical protein [Novosphingobium sp. Fuku2-ISO-50]KUR75332.1 hypothetical protein AQZ50_15865 [Novosphingobium sp. Fuku2-ISO-50]
MSEGRDFTQLQCEVERLTAENEALRHDGFRGSKAEAMLAFEYDRIPNVLKTPRAIRVQRKIATALFFVVPAMLVVVAVVGGINAYRDYEQSVETQRAASKWADDLRSSVQKNLEK